MLTGIKSLNKHEHSDKIRADLVSKPNAGNGQMQKNPNQIKKK